MYGRPRRSSVDTTTASRIAQYLQLRSLPQDKVECLLECREALESAKQILNEFEEGDDTTKTVQEQIDARLHLLKDDLLKRVMGKVVKDLLEGGGDDDTDGRASKVKKHSGDSDVHHHASDPYIEKEVYHGTLKHGKRHGQGTLTTSKFFYKGHFKDDKPHGSGMKKYKDAEGNEAGWYIGDFECGLRHGKGTLVDLRDKDNEIRFQGTFVKNKCVQGKVTTKTEEYEGSLLNELYEGMGKLRIKMDDDGIHEYTGTFREGTLVGKAKLRAFKDEEELVTIEGPFASHFTGLCSVVSPFAEYVGNLADGEYHGKGTMKHTGFTYRQVKCIAFDKGNWKSNMKHGKHVMKVYIAEGYNSSSRPVMEIESVFDNDVVKGNAKVRHYYIPEDTHMKRILDSEYVGCLSNEYLYDGKGVKTHKKYIYDGLYSYNLRHGKGVYTDVGTGMVVKGEFDDNFLDGRHVEVTYASGDVYEGQIKQDWNTHEFPEEEYLTSLTRNGPGVLKYGGGGLSVEEKVSQVSAVWEDDYPHIDPIMKRIHTNVKDGYLWGVK